MRKSRFTDEQIIKALNERAAGLSAADVRRKHGISDATKKKQSRFGGTQRSPAPSERPSSPPYTEEPSTT